MSRATKVLDGINANSAFGRFIAALDSWGVTIAGARLSLWTVLVALVVIVAAVVLARLAVGLSKKLLGKITTLDTAQRLLAQKVVSLAIWVFAVLMAIQLLGIDLTALTVFSGAFGLALGFGLQKTFGNLLAGMILLMDRSIKPGDVIAVNDGSTKTIGQVKKIGIRAVSVTTRDKKEYLIPNENLMVTQVENWSYSSKEVRVRIPVIVAIGCDLDLVEKLMIEAAHASPRVLDTPPPAILLTEFAERGVAFEIRVWINDPEEGLASVKSDVLKRMWKLFDANDIAMPDPGQSEISLADTPQLRELIAAIRAASPGSPSEPR
jgi:small-conductance mechanosensitive channel